MQTFKIYFLALLLVVLVVPQVSLAYYTSAQSAVQLNSDTLLYTVSYKFGFLNRELKMPIGVVRGLKFEDNSPYVGYSLLKDGETVVASGTASALVLSEAEIVDNEYYLPAGKAATFTLVALVKINDGFVSDNLAMQVTSLPFTMIKTEKKKKTEIVGRVNPTELKSYITPELDLK